MQSKTPGILEGKLYEAKQPLIVSVQLLREARQGQKRREATTLDLSHLQHNNEIK